MVTELKNTFDGHISICHTAKERICEHEERALEITQNEMQKKIKSNNNDDNFKESI